MSSCCISLCLLVLLGAVFATAKPLNFIPTNLRRTHESIADELGLKLPEIGGEHLFSPIIRGLNTSCQLQRKALSKKFNSKELQTTRPAPTRTLLISSDLVYPFITTRSLHPDCPQKHASGVQLMKTTLEVYMQIFSQASSLLDQVDESKRSSLRTDLIILQEKMKKLQEHLNHVNHDREHAFSRLNEIKPNYSTTQTGWVCSRSFSLGKEGVSQCRGAWPCEAMSCEETRDEPLVQKRALAEFLEVYQAASVTLHHARADCAA
ncbi:uncharacterized protein [Nothobranchius furzeri]|uniref:uncharacterized protein n=1 Tax=Nothobranchius furzeri TaxID=105023 RepID=UPI003904C2BE